MKNLLVFVVLLIIGTASLTSCKGSQQTEDIQFEKQEQLFKMRSAGPTESSANSSYEELMGDIYTEEKTDK